jgi:hypothetical protein
MAEPTRGVYGNQYSDSVNWRLNELKDMLPRSSCVRDNGSGGYDLTLYSLTHLEVREFAEFLKSKGYK